MQCSYEEEREQEHRKCERVLSVISVVEEMRGSDSSPHNPEVYTWGGR